jgi:LPS export ABC transporter permease LptG/LPS export ABC transporter permease LptF
VSVLDRYLIRQAVPPFFLALGIFTFVLAVLPTLDAAKLLLSKGVSIPTVGVLLLTLLPAALSLTIPMAFLTGVLMMLGRISAERESVALLACGVSPVRILRPILVFGAMVGALAMVTIMWATPASNQAYRRITFRLLTELTSAEIKPRVFFTKFPGKALYIRNISPDGRWSGIFMADTGDAGHTTVTLAEAGALEIDKVNRSVRVIFEQATRYEPGRSDSRLYSVSRQSEPISIAIPAESVFGSGQILPGLREMTFGQLQAEIARKHQEGIPAHAEIMQTHQMFSFPVACLVFALLALALGLSTRKEGRLAGLALGLAVVLAYYSVMALAEGWTKGLARNPDAAGYVDLAASWARWIPNILLGIAGLVALRRRTRPPSGRDWSVALPTWLPRRRPAAHTTSAVRATASGARDGRPVIVLRVPRTGLPVPRLLDRYVTMRFLAVIALTFLGLLTLFYIGTFVDLADKLFKDKADLSVFANFMIQSTPQFVVYVIPIAILVAVLGTIGGLTRSNELVVMRACGVSVYRIALPLLAFALAGSALLFTIDERVLGEANQTAAELRDSLRDLKPRPPTVMLATNQWMVGDDGRIYAYNAFGFDARPGGAPSLQGISAFETTEHPYRLRSHLHAARARFGGTNVWQAEHGWIEQFDGDTAVRTDFERQDVALQPVQDFQRVQVDPSTMTFVEYRDYVRRLGASGFNVAEPEVNLYRKIAFPLVTVVMTLLGVPFGVTIGKKGALYGIGLAAIIAGGYFMLMTFFVAAGSAALLPPMLAAWGANLIFGAGAAYMLLTMRT